jgi:hemerythrin-like domain-containing protein
MTTTDDRPDTRDMLVIHQVFRRELGLLPDLVRRVEPGDTARAATVAGHYALVARFLHDHHHGEDLLVWPLLHERAPEAAELVASMEADHARLAALLDEGASRVPAWAADPTAERRDAVATLADDLHAQALAHFDVEEREVLPLCERTLSVPEWLALGEHGRANIPQESAFTVMGMILEDAPPEVGQEMLAGLPAPVLEAWNQVGASGYADYTATVRGT